MNIPLTTALAATVCWVALSCASPKYQYSDLAVARTAAQYDDGQQTNRKILFSANLSITVKEPEEANQRMKEIARKHEGYVSEEGTARTVIRVSSARLEEAVEEVAALGKVTSKSLTGQDVTEDYLDLQVRLDNAQKARERYLELLAKAENVEAALKVEKELERLNETIDLLKGRINRIEHLDQFSTITARWSERKKPGLLGYVGIGLYQSVKWLFVRN
jgi:hypothetical protein